MIRIGIHIYEDADMEQVEALVAGFTEHLELVLPKELKQVGESIASDASGLAPVKTGALRASIKVEITETGVDVTSDVDYASYQELGTRHMPGKFFMDTALENHIEQIQEVIERVVKEYWKDVSYA